MAYLELLGADPALFDAGEFRPLAGELNRVTIPATRRTEIAAAERDAWERVRLWRDRYQADLGLQELGQEPRWFGAADELQRAQADLQAVRDLVRGVQLAAVVLEHEHLYGVSTDASLPHEGHVASGHVWTQFEARWGRHVQHLKGL